MQAGGVGGGEVGDPSPTVSRWVRSRTLGAASPAAGDLVPDGSRSPFARAAAAMAAADSCCSLMKLRCLSARSRLRRKAGVTC